MNNLKLSNISISEDLVNRDLRPLILSYLNPYVTDYRVFFTNHFIFLDLKLQIKGFGPLSAKYKLSINNFIFNKREHRIEVNYEEDVQSENNSLRSMFLKAMDLTQSTFLQKAIALSNRPGINADERNCYIDLEQFLDLNRGLVSKLNLNYLDSYDGMLKFDFFAES